MYGIVCGMVEARRLQRTLIIPDSYLFDRTNETHAINGGYYMLNDVLNITLMRQYVPILVVNDPLNYVLRMTAKKMRTLAVAPYHLGLEVRV